MEHEADESVMVRVMDLLRDTVPGVDVERARVARGGSHDVVLVPDEVAVRVARGARAVADLPRRTELLSRLARMELPFAVPEPLGPVHRVGDTAAVVTSWVPGGPSPKGEGDPARLRSLLRALADVPIDPLADVLAPPQAYAGGADRWPELMLEEVVPRLPARWRDEARARIDAALALPAVTPRLVHGDLAGDNVRWDGRGRLVGVLDWDLAAAWDPAVDAACLAWHGWDNVRAAVDAGAYERARVWYLTFGLEQVAVAILDGDPPAEVGRVVESTVRWLATAEVPRG